jgi:signal peptidase I
MLNKPSESEILKFSLELKKNNIITLIGKSMAPTFKEGWKVKIKPIKAREINLGDIIVFSQGELICHRIITKFKWNNKWYFVHKGDSEKIGRIFKEKELIGKVIEVLDSNSNIINKNEWHKSFERFAKFKLLGYVYIPLNLLKRLVFREKQNKLTCWLRKIFWRIFCI